MQNNSEGALTGRAVNDRRRRMNCILLSDETEELEEGVGRIGDAEVWPGVVVKVVDGPLRSFFILGVANFEC